MSVETITIVLSAAGLLLGFVGAFAWMIRRVDGQFERFEDRMSLKFAESDARMDARFAQVDKRFRQIDDRFGRVEDRFGYVDDRFTQLEERLGSRIGAVERELVEIKIALARLEGPPRRLHPVR